METEHGHGNAFAGEFFQQRLEILTICRGDDKPCELIPVVQDVFDHVWVDIRVIVCFRLSEDGEADVANCLDPGANYIGAARSEEHTSELQSRGQLVCRLL